MAISQSTLKVILTESIVINGAQQGGTNILNIPNIKNASKRIITIPTSEIQVVTFSTAVSAGAYIESSVKYIRLTNKDATNYITLVFKNEYNHEVSLKLDYGQSFIYNTDRSGGVVDTLNANQLAFGFTDATCDYNDDPTINCDASKQIIPGLRVSGTGIPTGATVASVNTPGAVTQFELSAATTGGAETNRTLTFTSGYGDLVDITAEAISGTCDMEIFIASE